MIISARSLSVCLSMQSAARRISSGSIYSIPLSKRVIVGRTDGLLRSKRCYAASVPSESFKEEKRSHRISKQERREMVEAFVDRYGASNAGKFPTISHAQKHVGGNFYLLREMIRELEYNHKMAPQRAEKPAELSRIDVIANTGESRVIKDAVPVESVVVEVPHISRVSEEVFMEEFPSHSTIEIIHASEVTTESFENSGLSRQISSHNHIDKEFPEKDFPSRLVNEDVDDGVSDLIKSQSINIGGLEKQSPLSRAEANGKDDVHELAEFQANASVTLKLESEVDNLSTPVHDIRGSIEDRSSTICAEEEVEQKINEDEYPVHDIHGNIEDRSSTACADEEVKQRIDEELSPAQDMRGIIEEKRSAICTEEEMDQRSNEEKSKFDAVNSDDSKTVEEEASSPNISSIWRNLISLADLIIKFWRKK